MKLAYLVSRYPSVSHTFILREIQALRKLGVAVGTFSVRHPVASEVLGTEAQEEMSRTKCLVPATMRELIAAFFRCVYTRPLLFSSVFAVAVLRLNVPMRERFKWLCYFGEAVLLSQRLQDGTYEHLHCHFGNNGASTGMLAARLARIPFSMTCHGSELLEIERHRLVEKVRQAAFVACVSHYGKAQLMRVCDPDGWSKLHVVRCGPPRSIQPTPRETAGALEVLCVGRLSPEKGHLVLLDALARLRDRQVDVRCTIVGGGPLFDDVVARMRALRLAERVELTGPLPPERVAARYAGCDVVVLPSFSEGVPVVLMEAMAGGRAVVATRVGGVAELIEHGKTGLLVAPGDPEELAAAIRQIADDPQAAARMGRRGAKTVRREFDIEASARQLLTLFERHHGGGIGWVSEAPPAEQKVAGLLVVSPVRDEAEYIQQTIDSMVAQTVRPAAWIVVDDGSTDDTPAIVERAADEHDWIRLHRRSDRGVRKVGAGVVEAFDEGVAQVNLDDFEYVCKFDGDLAFGPRYFEGLFEKFDADPKLGTASGKSWIESDGRYVPERTGDDFSQGQTKLYRVECFKKTGGFVREVMWDGIDCHRCRMTGWRARSFRDPELRFVHLRPMGSSFRSIYRGRLRWGYGQYFMGTHPLYALGIGVYRMLERPWLVGGLLILAGYIGGYLRRRPRYDDARFRRFLRRWQLARLGWGRTPEMP